MGLFGTNTPVAYGGLGLSMLGSCLAVEEIAKAHTAFYYLCGVNVHIGSKPIELAGSEAQKRRWLPKMASGEIITSIAMTEPGTGSDLQSVKTRAIRDGDHYVVNGAKTFITNGYNANLIVLVCKTNPAERARGISLLCVEVDDLPGFRRGKPLKKIGQKGQDTCELFFDDCRVPVENLLGEQEGQGFYQLMNQLGRERLMIGLAGVSTMENAVRVTADYVKQREAFGQKLMDFQNTRFTLVECATEAHIARVFIDHCIGLLIAGQLDAATASMSKYWCSDKGFEIAHRCLQLHGGYGYTLDYPIAHYFADARVASIYGGSNEIMKELIARSL
jgi:acyl-CoA dehydrogenase